MPDTAYRNARIPLDNVVTDTQRKYVDEIQKGTVVYGIYVVRANFVDNPLPAGAQVKLFFGDGNDEVILSDDMVSFEFPCGHDGGILFSNAVALSGKEIRLLCDMSGFGLRREA